MIVLDKVSKAFKRRHGINQVLKDVDLTFEDGTHTAILGLNYSGKSTLINMMTGILRPDSGHIYRSGKISYPINALAVVHAAMTVRQNISFLCQVYGFDPKPVQEFVEHYTGLPRLMDEYVGNLVQSERLQFVFTIGYALPFETYLIDGTYAGGPPMIRERTAKLMSARIEDSGLVLATKNSPTARAYCTRAIVLDGPKPYVYEDIEDGIAHYTDLVRRGRSAVAS